MFHSIVHFLPIFPNCPEFETIPMPYEHVSNILSRLERRDLRRDVLQCDEYRYIVRWSKVSFLGYFLTAEIS